MDRSQPRQDWRSIVSAIQETPLLASEWAEQLLECVTEASLPEIDAALDDWSRNQFRQEVFFLELERRFGSADSFTSLHAPEVPWTPEWTQRMEVAARYYLERADDTTREALRQRERLFVWSTMAPATRPEAGAVLELTLHSDPHVADLSLSMLSWFAPPLPDVLAWCVPVLRSGEPKRVGVGLEVLRHVPGRHSALLDSKIRHEVELRICTALAGRDEAEVHALVTRLASSPAWPSDVAASCVVALGLTGEVLPLLSAALATCRPWRRTGLFDFIAALGTPAAGARSLLLEHLDRAGSHEPALSCLRALGRIGTPAGELLTLARKWTGTDSEPQRTAVLRALVAVLAERDDGESEVLPALCQHLLRETHAPDARVGLLWLLRKMSPSRRQALFPGLAEPAELLLGLLEDTRESPPAMLSGHLLELYRDSPRLHAWLMRHALERPDDMLSSAFFYVVGPECGELLVPLQQRIADTSAHRSLRGGWVEALGRIAPGPDSPALRGVSALFTDARERLPLRLTAAQTLWTAGVRGVHGLAGPELAPALRDPSAAIRSWALLLARDVEAGLLASLREDPVALVRQLAMTSEGAGTSWPVGANGGLMP